MTYHDYKKVYVDRTLSLKDWQNSRGSGKIITRRLATGQALDIRTEGASPKLVDSVDANDSVVVQRTIKYFESRIAEAKIENGVVITTKGEVYHCTGHLNGLPTIEELGDKLKGTAVTHNHPRGSVNEYSFSEGDLILFEKYKLTKLRGIDELFVYELNRNNRDIDEEPSLEEALKSPPGTLSRHGEVIKKAKELNIGYRRWRR